MHSDPLVYEKPFKFMPERWLGDINPDMMRNFVPFSRGPAANFPMMQTLLTRNRFSQLFGPESGAGRAQSGDRCAISPWRRAAGVV